MPDGSESGVRICEKADDAVMDDGNVSRVVRGITGFGVLESEIIHPLQRMLMKQLVVVEKVISP